MPPLLERLRNALAPQYEVERELASGGMGTVFLARDPKLDRNVAIKVLKPDLISSDASDRFLREARILAKLSHPNIVPVHAAGDADGLSYYVMEYVEGDTLKRRLESGAMPKEEALKLADDLLAALEAAHERGIVHRDVKPSNIFLVDDRALLADFGIAKPSDPSEEGLTAPGERIGTPRYMPPEQLLGEDVTPATDVFAAGMLICEALTGRRWSIASLGENADWSDVPGELAAPLRRALEWEPEDRWQKAASLRSALARTQRVVRKQRAIIAGAAAAATVVLVAGWFAVSLGTGGRGSGRDPSIAVLPFENRSGLEDDRYFTDGIHDEILTRLSRIGRLSVRARTSVMEYRDSPKNIRQIGEELDARYILEGGVQRAGAQVRINVQLIDSETDEHVFAEAYDRELSIENLLAVQRDLAMRIADALQATLTPEERRQIARVPTDDFEAYDYYLRALEYLGRPGVRQDNYENAQRMLEQGIALDPRFALAYARLSTVHAEAYEYGLDRSDERLGWARQAADRALEIDPGLPEGQLALGYYHYVIRVHDVALEELAIAERGLPGSPWLLWVRALTQKRQGQWEEATASLERALELSPREPYLLFEMGMTYFSLRRYDDAEGYFDMSLALQPDAGEVAVVRTLVSLIGMGDSRPLRAFLEPIPLGFDPGGAVMVLRWTVEYFDREYAAALDVLSHSEREYFEWQGGIAPRSLLTGLCYAGLGETDRARAAGDSARAEVESWLEERPEDPRLYASLSTTFSLIGLKEEAIWAAQRAVELLPVSEDAVDGPGFVRNLATIYARFGEVEAAVEQFDRYLSMPSLESIKSIVLDRQIDPIRNDPRFQALVEKYERDAQ
jgi:serine/threonine-protein kinase